MDDRAELERLFSRASQKAQLMANRKILTDEETTELKGLFHQAQEGDGNNWKILNDPKLFVSSDSSGKNLTYGMSKLDAMQKYIDLVEHCARKHHIDFAPSRDNSCSSLASASSSN